MCMLKAQKNYNFNSKHGIVEDSIIKRSKRLSFFRFYKMANLMAPSKTGTRVPFEKKGPPLKRLSFRC